MRREEFLKGKRSGRFVVAVLDSIMIISILIVLITAIVLTASCSGLTIIDDGELPGTGNEQEQNKIGEEGTLFVSFTKEYKTNDVINENSIANATMTANAANTVITANAYSRSMPDTNSFILSIKKVAGEPIYKGLYSQRPKEMKLAAGSYDVEVYSREFTVPEFDAPCYYDSGSVVVEAGKITTFSFLCRQSNGAIRLGFTPEFKNRFTDYTAEIEDCKGKALYSFTEARFLFLNPGDIFIRLKASNSSGGNVGSFLITRKSIAAMEMVTVNLHSSVAGGGPGGEIPPGDSQVFTGILIDTSSVWLSEDVVVGERHDGSTKELALTVDEIAGYVGAKGVWVSGYVAGFLTTASLISSGPFENETNIAIASIPGEQNRELCAGVALTAGTVRATLNLKSNPTLLGKKVFVRGTITESYFGLKGVNSVNECFVE
ncbi:MAG: DUF6359 domain-containing protein [Bacteroidales bacterium]